MFGVAVALRLVVGASLADLPLIRTPKLDSAEYLSWALRIAGGNFGWPPVSPHAPGYPLFLAAIFALGGSIWTATVLQSFIGGVTAVCVTIVGNRMAGPRAGLCAGLLYATFGPAVFVETSLLSEGLLLAFLMGAMVLLTAPGLKPISALFAGVLLGAATFVRPTALFIAGTLMFALWWIVAKQQRMAIIRWCVCGLLLVLVPALAKSWHDSRTVSLQGFGGLNIYIGDSPLHSGRPVFRLGAGWEELNSEAHRAGIDDPRLQDRYYVVKTAREISDRPFAFARLVATKALWLVQSAEVRDSHSFYFFADQSSVLAVLPRMIVLAPLALAGAFVLLRRSAVPPLVTAYAIGSALGVVLLVVGTRYRLPFVPVLAIWGGIGCIALADAARHQQWRLLANLCGVVVVGIVCSSLLHDPSSRNLSEEWAFTGMALVSEHRPSEAEAAYKRALASDSASALAWDGLGVTLYDERRWPEARTALDRAAQLDPVNARTAYHLGLLDEAEQRPADAISALRRTLEVDPENVDAMRHLASDLSLVRRDAEAVTVLRSIVAATPDDAQAHRTLAGALAGSGDLAAARAELNTALNLRPSDAEAWLDLCLVSLDLRQPGDAAAACGRARELGASSDRLQFAERALENQRPPLR